MRGDFGWPFSARRNLTGLKMPRVRGLSLVYHRVRPLRRVGGKEFPDPIVHVSCTSASECPESWPYSPEGRVHALRYGSKHGPWHWVCYGESAHNGNKRAAIFLFVLPHVQ